MKFYDKFCSLCKLRGISPSRAALNIGISKSAVSKWKSMPDVSPSLDTLVQIAAYFGVSVNELVSEEKLSESNADRELEELLDMLRYRPECRILLSTAKGATKEQVEANIRVIEAIRGYKE